MSDTVRNVSEAISNRMVQIRDAVAQLADEARRLEAAREALGRDVFEDAVSNGHSKNGDAPAPAKKRGRPKKVATTEPTPRRTGLQSDLVLVLTGKEEGLSVKDIADATNREYKHVAMALTAGKKKGRFRQVSRGVWTLAQKEV